LSHSSRRRACAVRSRAAETTAAEPPSGLFDCGTCNPTSEQRPRGQRPAKTVVNHCSTVR
jgi:hypothetical protein